MADRPYSRVYWSVMDDSKFDAIRDDMRHFGSWTLMLIVAEMAHPAPAFVPPTVPRPSLRALVEAGLIDELPGGRYRVHGLASERDMRSQSARNAAAVRWQSERNALRNAKPMLAETSIDKTSNGARTASGKPRPNSVDRDPHLRELRAAIEKGTA